MTPKLSARPAAMEACRPNCCYLGTCTARKSHVWSISIRQWTRHARVALQPSISGGGRSSKCKTCCEQLQRGDRVQSIQTKRRETCSSRHNATMHKGTAMIQQWVAVYIISKAVRLPSCDGIVPVKLLNCRDLHDQEIARLDTTPTMHETCKDGAAAMHHKRWRI